MKTRGRKSSEKTYAAVLRFCEVGVLGLLREGIVTLSRKITRLDGRILGIWLPGCHGSIPDKVLEPIPLAKVLYMVR